MTGANSKEFGVSIYSAKGIVFATLNSSTGLPFWVFALEGEDAFELLSEVELEFQLLPEESVVPTSEKEEKFPSETSLLLFCLSSWEEKAFPKASLRVSSFLFHEDPLDLE